MRPKASRFETNANAQALLSTQRSIVPVIPKGLALSRRLGDGSVRPRLLRIPADWWDSPSAFGCLLSRGPQASSAARRLTRGALSEWGLASLAEDAETIVGELVANAVIHAAPSDPEHAADLEGPRLSLLRRAGEMICAVLDASDAAPVLKPPGETEEGGRGLQLVDSLSDIWGWSPLAGRGKAVWAILFCNLPA